MHYTTLGKTGLKVSRICLGTMTFGWSADEEASHHIMDVASEYGITFFDSADIYSAWIDGNKGGESEAIIGSWLKNQPRQEYVIATKVRGRMWPGANGEGLSRAHILQAAEDSLRRLQTDYIDLYQVHFPDADTPLDETLSALDHLVQSGKVRYIGCSNFPAWLLMKALWVSDVRNLVRFASIQPHYSVFHRKEFETELAAACLDQGVGVIPYSPLAAGFATGKYQRDATQPDSTRSSGSLIQRLIASNAAWDALDLLRDIARQHDVPVAQVALAWQLSKPAVTASIIGARTVEQLNEALGAETLQLSADEISRIDAATATF